MLMISDPPQISVLLPEHGSVQAEGSSSVVPELTVWPHQHWVPASTPKNSAGELRSVAQCSAHTSSVIVDVSIRSPAPSTARAPLGSWKQPPWYCTLLPWLLGKVGAGALLLVLLVL